MSQKTYLQCELMATGHAQFSFAGSRENLVELLASLLLTEPEMEDIMLEAMEEAASFREDNRKATIIELPNEIPGASHN